MAGGRNYYLVRSSDSLRRRDIHPVPPLMYPANQRLLVAASTLLASAFVSAQFTDDFTDMDLITGAVWSGNNALFTAATGAMQSQSPGAANYYLSTPSTQTTSAQWDYFINLKFATSGANYADVYLMSSAADLQSGVSGYFVRTGGTADRVELFRSDAGVVTSLIASPDGIVNSASNNPFNIQVKREANNTWTLLYDDGALGTFSTAGQTTDATYTSCTHFGIRIEQSTLASAVNNHYFDNIVVGPIIVDSTPPSVLSATAISATQLDILFSEPVAQITAENTNNYNIIPFNSAASVVRDATNLALVHVTLSLVMLSGNTYTVTVNGVQDLTGNACANQIANVFYFVPDIALPGDVIINEVMADPTPVVGLPDAEFVEIYNRTTNKTFDLANWTFSDGGSPLLLPAFTLAPGAYLILTSASNVPALSTFGPVIAPSGSLSLVNTGDPLTLLDPGGITIDAVTYDDSWYNDAVKVLGGWSLERINPTAPCSSAANWAASIAPQGGTPDAQNSVYAIVPDITAPSLVSVLVNSATQIQLVFSEAMDVSGFGGGTYTITPAISIAQVDVIDAFTVQLTLAQSLTIGQIYTIAVAGVTDCPGNMVGSANTATFVQPEPVLPGDVVINEVLYDPIGYGSDLVELYNRSDKVLSLANWKLANESNGVIGNESPITTTSRLLLPGQYVLITENSANIASTYPLSHTDRFVETTMPSYNNGNGVVVLQDPLGDTLDRFAYNDNLHFALLNSTEGVSLERVNPDRPTSDNTNWHSAAETVGFATPGYQNSQYSANTTLHGALTIETAIFSPDNDGYQDLLTIAYKFDAPGFTGTMKVFDIAGREVKTLLDNELLGTIGAISWDGIMETGDLARMGPYVVYFEAFDLSGNVEKFRETVVLAHKLD